MTAWCPLGFSLCPQVEVLCPLGVIRTTSIAVLKGEGQEAPIPRVPGVMVSGTTPTPAPWFAELVFYLTENSATQHGC